MNRYMFLVGLIALCVSAAPRNNLNDVDSLRELVDLLEEKVRQHKLENQLLRDNRMIYMADAMSDHIWLVMQRDVSWADSYTYEVQVTDAETGENWMTQSPITWGRLDQPDHAVTDGKLQGYTRAIRVSGRNGTALKSGHEYRITEIVRTGPGGKEIFSKSKVYTTAGRSNTIDGGNSNGNNGNTNGNNGNNGNTNGNSNGNNITTRRPTYDDETGFRDCKSMQICRDRNGNIRYDGNLFLP